MRFIAMLPRGGAIVLLALGLLACGSSATVDPAATIVVDEASAGQTVDAHVGDTVEVRLVESFPVPGSSLVWDASTSAPSVLRLDRVTRDPADRPRQGTVKYTADFTVLAAGQATIFARGSQTCEAMPSCPQRDFTVTVVVAS